MSEPKWLLLQTLATVQRIQISEHGGLQGIRDQAGLEACLERPRSAYAYGATDLYDLAAKYAHGIVTRHPFVDGNKRMGLIAAAIFLRLNGLRLAAREVDTVIAFRSLAAGQMTEALLAVWLRENSQPL